MQSYMDTGQVLFALEPNSISNVILLVVCIGVQPLLITRRRSYSERKFA